MTALMSFLFYSVTTVHADSSFAWVDMPPLPEERAGASVSVVDGKIYVIGGAANGSESANGTKRKTTYVYDPSTNEWSEKAPMPTARAAVTSVVYGSKIYVIGGYYGSSSTTRTKKVEIYDTLTDTWTTGTNMSTARSWASAVLLDNKIYVIGGHDSSNYLKTVECFDIETETWEEKNKFPVATQGKAAISYNEDIYTFGGTFGSSSGQDDSIYEYNAANDKWTKVSELSTNRVSAGIFTYEDKIFIVGGDIDGTKTSKIEIYDPNTNEVTDFTELSFARSQSAVVVLDGDVYIIGGLTESEGITNSVQKLTLNNEQEDPETPVEPQPDGDRAILVITMVNGLEKEYDLSMDEVNAFLDWYDAKDAGSGPSKFAIDKHDNNLGPFSSRTDYAIFNNILTFEVNAYN